MAGQDFGDLDEVVARTAVHDRSLLVPWIGGPHQAVVPAWIEDFRADVEAVRASGKPALILHGTADRILPIDATGRGAGAGRRDRAATLWGPRAPAVGERARLGRQAALAARLCAQRPMTLGTPGGLPRRQLPDRPDEVPTMTLPRRTTRFGPLQVAICVLALATAVVHIYLGVLTNVMVATQPEATAAAGGATALGFFAALFYLDGLAYIVLTAALYYPGLARFRRVIRWALIALTAATIVAYFALIQGQYDALGIGNKINEVLLIVLLVVEGRRDRTGLAAAVTDGNGR